MRPNSNSKFPVKKRFNILMLGGAKRVSMARLLKKAGAARGLDVTITSYELHADVPIACEGDVIEGLRWNDPGIGAALHEIVIAREIDAIIPFVDPAVAVAARYVDVYGDTFAPVSDRIVCEMMHDKILAADAFERAAIPAPATYRRGKPEFPLIAKPRTGSASKGIKVIENATDFRLVITPADRYVIQEYIARREEYTVDCYVGRSGIVCCISPRLRQEVTGGEVSRTTTVDIPELTLVARNALERLRLKGAVTIQFLRDLDTGRLLIMEVNPRLGGGAVCSVHAGADIPGMIIDEAMGLEPQPCTALRAGTEIARYMDEVVFHKPIT